MIDNKFHVKALVLAGMLGGCAGVPPLDIPSPLTVAHIIDKIQCEVWQAGKENPRFRNGGYTAVANLTLQVDDSLGLTPTVNFIHPLATAGTQFAFGASAALKGARLRIYTEQIEMAVAQAKQKSCHTKRDTFSLTGELGIVESVALAMSSVDGGDTAKLAAKEAFGHTIQFVITKNVSGVGPMWTLVHFTGPGGLLGAERVDTHKLIISFARPDTKGAAPASAADKARNLNFNMQFQSAPLNRLR